MSGVDISEAQDVALEILAQAIRRAGTTPCADDDRWISDSPAVQALAARRCQGCPVFDQCDAYAQQFPRESGVYAGLTEADRLPVTQEPRKPPKRRRTVLTPEERLQHRREASRRSRARHRAAQAATQEGIPA
ncbi:MAG: WhiB family transcriptional regulator [Actinomyces sp.]|nr:WhiB family transcriptional regulator [Actinomyces sp.]MCI1788617.1 WhiB family transcriptional regulator [Actinomyces sp.]MCI1829719.1 WhiB family transcriptional regulator [Actinomyces sp.]